MLHFEPHSRLGGKSRKKTMDQKLRHVAAGILLLLATLFVYRAILPDISGRLPEPARHETRQQQLVYHADQVAVSGMIGLKASRMAADPFNFAAKSSCFPLTAPYTLGEHMFGEAALGVIPQALSSNPVTTFNIVTILHLWIAGLSMYTLAFFWTRSIPAALLAAILFALHPLRTTNPAHLFTNGNIWTPLALLAAHRVIYGGRWRDTFALTALLILQLLESFYQTFGLFLLGGIYGADLLWQYRDRLKSRIPQISFFVGITAIFAWWLFAPYLHARETWGILQGRESTILLQITDFLPGGDAGIGWLALILALVGLGDRMRQARRRNGVDPRLPLLAGGAAVLLCSIPTVPGLGIPSPVFTLREILPGMDGIRVLRSIAVGVFLVADFLAAYGLLVLLEWCPRKSRPFAATAVVCLALLAVTHPQISKFSFGRSSQIGARAAGLSPEIQNLYQQVPEGSVLDLPAYFGPWRKVADGPVYLSAAGYHGQPTAACYNSFSTYVQDGIQELAKNLPAPEASDALYALGFRTLAIHHGRGGTNEGRRLRPLVADSTRLELIGKSEELSLYELKGSMEISEDLSQLQTMRTTTYAHPITLRIQWVPFYITNASDSVFRHPEPIEPREVAITWRNQAGKIFAESKSKAFLPLALGPRSEIGRGIELEIPALPAGTYLVSASFEDRMDRPLGKTRVTLQPGAGLIGPRETTD
jgi:hypothetical protein